MQQIAHRPGQEARRLIPSVITQNLAAGCYNGSFPAAGLYLDLSGFTNLTESLIEYGTDGVEVLTNTVETLFAPLIESAFAHGGFVAGYAGDAFLALFPRQTGEDDTAVALRAIGAAQTMQASMRTLGDQHLDQADYPLQAKIGLGLGYVEWEITTARDNERAVYYFRGQAVSDSALAENEAQPGEIVASQAFYDAVAAHVNETAANRFYRINAATPAKPDAAAAELPEATADELVYFVPASVVYQSTKGEFRQILSLFVNLEGQPSAEELRPTLAEIFPLLQKYGGLLYRVNFDDKGCNLYIFWGAPTSHESDLRRALAFVLELREACDLRLRAGLTYRMAYAGFMGSPLYEEYTCYSRGVNLASRLMTGAPWGEIWLDSAVAHRADLSHEVELVGERRFKGIAEPEAVYRLVGRRSGNANPFFRGAFVGRETELRQMTEGMSALDRGESAGVYTIVGEAGIGKSRLVHEFLEQPSSAGYQVLVCQSDEILKQPFNAFRYGLRRYFQQPVLGDEGEALAAFNEVLNALIAATADEELQAELHRTRSFIGHVIDLHWPNSLYERVNPQLRLENTQNALKTLFRAMSRQKPLIIHIEDAHALDRETLSFLPLLMHNMDKYPIALILTTRQPLEPDPFERETRHRVRRLLPLNKAATARLVEALAGTDPAQETLDSVAAHAEGNPLFVEQMLLLLEQGDPSSDSPTTDRGTGGLVMPTDVRSLLIARLDQLPAQVRESALVASVLGREFDVNTLATMLDDPPAFDTLLNEGAANDIWYSLNKSCYFFRHTLLKDVAYDMQLRSRRRVLHGRAATVLTQETVDDTTSASRLAEIAYHYDHGEMAREAAYYYKEAGDLAAAAYSNEQAVEYFTRALQLTSPSDLERRYDLLSGREAVYGLLGRRKEQLADMTAMASALVAIPNNGRRSELLLRQAAYALALGDYDEAIGYAQRAADIASADGDTATEARAYHRLGRTLWQQGRSTEAEPTLQKALALTRPGDNRIEEAECLHDLGVVWQYLGNPQTAVQYSREAREMFRAANHVQGLVRCINLLGIISYSQGQFAESAAAYEEALASVREIGWRYAEVTLLQNSSNHPFEIGDYELARALHEDALAIARDTAFLESETVSLDTLGLIAHCRQDHQTAQDYFARGLSIARQIANERSLGYLLIHEGLALAETGAPEQAIGKLTEALEIRQQLANEPAITDTLAVLALAQLRAGNASQAAATFDRVLEWIAANDVEMLELPIKWYLIGVNVYTQADGSGLTTPDSRARRCLQAGYDLLQARADRMKDNQVRESYLSRVPYNRDLLALWQANN